MKTIMLVEDDPFIQDIYGMRLKKEGYGMVVAPDCEVALEQLKSTHPDLMVLDIDFGAGKMQGWQLLEIMRDDARMKDIKVMVISNANPETYPGNFENLKIDKIFLKVETTPEDIVNSIKQVLS